jgi:hemoglobin
MQDIQNSSDIEQLVNQFYEKVLKDETLKNFFKHLNFEAHKPKMIHFWSFVLLDESGYTTNVTEKHIHMKINKIHFDRWIFLFDQTIDELFEGEKANLAKQRAKLIAWTMGNKIDAYTNEKK